MINIQASRWSAEQPISFLSHPSSSIDARLINLLIIHANWRHQVLVGTHRPGSDSDHLFSVFSIKQEMGRKKNSSEKMKPPLFFLFKPESNNELFTTSGFGTLDTNRAALPTPVSRPLTPLLARPGSARLGLVSREESSHPGLPRGRHTEQGRTG